MIISEYDNEFSQIQQAQVEEQRQKEANETALAAIGKPKKRKLEESTNHHHHHHASTLPSNGPEQISPIQPSPSSNAVSSTNLNSKSVSDELFEKNACDEYLHLFLSEQLNEYVERIFVIFFPSWNEINISNEQHYLLKH